MSIDASITEFFEQDHKRLDAIFNRFQKTVDKHSARKLFNQFKTGLLQHIVWEEELLFPAIEQAAGFSPNAGPTFVMRMEHQQIKQCLDNIELGFEQDTPIDPECNLLFATLEQHNVKEETILYPHSDNMITAADKAALLEKIQTEQAA